MYGTKRSFFIALYFCADCAALQPAALFFLFDLRGYMGCSMTNAQMLF
jgi:hypothetical protein